MMEEQDLTREVELAQELDKTKEPIQGLVQELGAHLTIGLNQDRVVKPEEWKWMDTEILIDISNINKLSIRRITHKISNNNTCPHIIRIINRTQEDIMTDIIINPHSTGTITLKWDIIKDITKDHQV